MFPSLFCDPGSSGTAKNIPRKSWPALTRLLDLHMHTHALILKASTKWWRKRKEDEEGESIKWWTKLLRGQTPAQPLCSAAFPPTCFNTCRIYSSDNMSHVAVWESDCLPAVAGIKSSNHLQLSLRADRMEGKRKRALTLIILYVQETQPTFYFKLFNGKLRKISCFCSNYIHFPVI